MGAVTLNWLLWKSLRESHVEQWTAKFSFMINARDSISPPRKSLKIYSLQLYVMQVCLNPKKYLLNMKMLNVKTPSSRIFAGSLSQPQQTCVPYKYYHTSNLTVSQKIRRYSDGKRSGFTFVQITT